MITLTLPWPHKDLSPNSNKGWQLKARLKKKAREDAFWLAMDVVPNHNRGPRTVRFYPPDNRHRDDDNMIGSLKAARDGVADAIKFDDKFWRPSYEFMDPVEGGKVEILFEEKHGT